jgi:threonine/homoserine/homoserine lactone efflux protein
VANPKAYAAIGAVFSSTTVIAADPVGDATAKIAALSLVIVAVNGSWLAFGSLFSRWLRDPLLGRIVNVTFAVLLIGSVGLSLMA